MAAYQLFTLPKQLNISSSFALSAGAKAYFFATTTTTPQDTFTDAALTIPHAHPVVADAAGVLPPIYFDPTLQYKLTLNTAADVLIYTVDPVNDQLLSQSIIGATLYPRTAAEISASVTPTDYSYQFGNVKRYGATAASSMAANKTALQLAVSAAAQASGSALIEVPADINYGYDVTDISTFPNFTGVTVPVVVLDYGAGDSFAGYPTAYDGAQQRIFFHTPQTTAAVTFTAGIAAAATSATLTTNWLLFTGPWTVTFSNGDVRNVTFTTGATTATWTGGLSSSATANATFINLGQHEGNQIVIRNNWNPGVWIHSDTNLAAPGHASRLALDNCRAQFGYGVNGNSSWFLTQGTLNGPGYTIEELSNFALQKISMPGDTIGDFFPFTVERKTGNMSFGSGGNVPVCSYDFYSVTSGKDQAMFENAWDTQSRIYCRSSGGSTSDAGIGVDSSAGTFFLWSRSTGHFLDFNVASRVATFSSGIAHHEVAASFSASIAIAANSGDAFIITANSGIAYTIGAPSNGTLGQQITIVVRNTSGGALGAATWNAAFKMAAWTNPANGNSRSITFRNDNTNWVEMSRTPADVPN